jgi:hypothetical protein
MIQEIITYFILLFTISVTIVKLYRFFFKKSATACSSCFQAKSGCKVAHLGQRIKNHEANQF